MGMIEAVKLFFARYTDFQGRSSRAEYWWAYLGLILLIIVPYSLLGIFAAMGITALAGFIGIVLLIFYFAIIIPSIAIVVRRLHDTDRSGWWYFISLVPLVGFIVLLVFLCTEGTKGSNRFGEDPYGRVDASVFE